MVHGFNQFSLRVHNSSLEGAIIHVYIYTPVIEVVALHCV